MLNWVITLTLEGPPWLNCQKPFTTAIFTCGWLANYEAATPGVEFGDNATVILDADNETQPDALLRIETGGESIINEDDYIEGAPELIVEIAASTASYDLHDKKNVYRRSGVKEYLVWRSPRVASVVSTD